MCPENENPTPKPPRGLSEEDRELFLQGFREGLKQGQTMGKLFAEAENNTTKPTPAQKKGFF